MTIFQSNKKGFTLIELMIVIIIIGILIAIASQLYIKYQIQAKCNSCVANLRKIEDCGVMYMTHTSLDIIDTNELISSTAHGWDGPYIRAIPMNPFNYLANHHVKGNQLTGLISTWTDDTGIGNCCTL